MIPEPNTKTLSGRPVSIFHRFPGNGHVLVGWVHTPAQSVYFHTWDGTGASQDSFAEANLPVPTHMNLEFIPEEFSI